jgi:hypothetical protein
MKKAFCGLSTVLAVVSILGAQSNPPAITTPDSMNSRLGTLHFKDGMPDQATAAKLYDELDYVHAADTFLNGIAAVNMWALRKGFLDAGINDGDVLIFSELMDAKSLFLTANADTPYFFTFIDLSKGPVVISAPPLSLAIVDDMWWRYVTDMGLAGPDRGVGARYLLVPPGYKGPLPDDGFFIRRSRTNRIGVLGRGFLENNDPKPAIERVKQTLRIYPYIPGFYGTSVGEILDGYAAPPMPWTQATWAEALQPVSAPKFVEGMGKVMNTIPPNDFSFFDMLNDAVQDEPAEALDPEIAGSFAEIGIVKGKPFSPDARMRKLLESALVVANGAARTVTFRPRMGEGFNYYGESSAWVNTLFAGSYNFMAPPPLVTTQGVKPFPSDGARKLNSRAAMFYVATGITPAMVMRLTGIGSAYLGAFLDSKGQPLDGAKTYKINLPKGIPAAKFWSLTVYANQTRSMLDTPQRYPRAGSQAYPSPAASMDPDGSINIFFAPKRPAGAKEGNWIQTVPGKGWFVLLRLYSPLEPFFDKSWRPAEVEEVK